MSLQDDYYELSEYLESCPAYQNILLERIWFAFCKLEAEMMVKDGEMTAEQYNEWLTERLANLNAKSK